MTNRRKNSPAGPLQALWTPRFRYRGGILYWMLIGIPALMFCLLWNGLVVMAWLLWVVSLGIHAGVRSHQRKHR